MSIVNKMITIVASFLTVFFISIVFIPTAYTASIINNVSGTIAHRNTITISGSGFGSKSASAPIRYDDFHTGTIGQSPSFNEAAGGWDNSYGNGNNPTYSSTKYRTSKGKSLKQDFTGGKFNSEIGLTEATLGSTNELYFSGWFTFESSGAASRNVKVLNLGQDASDGWQSRIDVYPSSSSGHLYAYVSNNCSGSTSSVAQNWSVSPSNTLKSNDGLWHRLESYVKLGPSGYRDLYVDGNFIGSISGAFTSGNCGIQYFYISYYYATDTGSPTPSAIRYWDEFYVDNTRARVEIGNASTWAACTHREIQIPSAWSSSSITATVNQGTFSAGQAAYLYVIDANGTVNTSGYPLTFGQGQGGGSDTTPPSTPTGVSITILP